MVSPHVRFWQLVLAFEHGYTNVIDHRNRSPLARRRRVLVRQTSLSRSGALILRRKNEKTEPFPVPD